MWEPRQRDRKQEGTVLDAAALQHMMIVRTGRALDSWNAARRTSVTKYFEQWGNKK
ncbi:hypothetical protein LR69_01197 [Geobacillus sp. BCO2]|nr:hypothetical protein LR69_01197 [Geobacillus sp. BCO2]